MIFSKGANIWGTLKPSSCPKEVVKAQEKSQKAKEKVDAAIKRLIKLKASINFNSVAEEAGVSFDF